MNKKYKVILLFTVIILLLIGISISKKNQDKVNISGGILQEGVIPGYTEEEIKEILQRKADESSFSFEINSRPIFKDGSSEGNLRIANPPYNKYSIKVEIKLDSNSKTVFKSGEILPNHYIEYAKLTKRLKAGEYNATATINAYDTKTGEYKGTSAAKLIIKVES
ncbi:MAG: hypothetical protein SOR73_13300 [Romboutsia timonensis]|uniref:hypothetical protein n=1 Tax=Romboutsia timonensis TaxID=1776391 RepID=UPI002A75D765|nr:hypothetical protein [Romboutsia timonensis]MDY3002631.1 hypothetical protein [Romboutsia timonensis]